MTAVSTFSGCGGSCLGLKRAGFEVVWASEFVEAARAVYDDNHAPARADARDIRLVDAADILGSTGLAKGELDLLEGSPPCAAFSTAGKRDQTWGKVRFYSGLKQRSDDLFFEYARLLRGLMPKAFISENVPGLIKGKAKGYFKLIRRELESCGYDVQARIVSAHWLGVSQCRERLFIAGVRKDLGKVWSWPKPVEADVSLASALQGVTDPGPFATLKEGSILRRVYDLARPGECFADTMARVNRWSCRGNHFTHYRLAWDRPTPTVCAQATSIYHPDQPRSLGINELKRVCGFPDEFRLSGSLSRQWERLGRAVPPPVMQALSQTLIEEVLS